MAELKLDSPLQFVKGVGPRKAEVLAQHGLTTVRDLLSYLPRSYLDRTSITAIKDVKVDQPATVVGQVKAHGMLHGKRRRYEVILQDETGALPLVFFQGLRYWERLFKKGQWFAATGTVGYFQGYQMVHPDLERLEDEGDQMIHAGRIVPVYPQTTELIRAGLGSKGIRRLTTFVLANLAERIDDPVPSEETARCGLPARHEAIAKIHYPDRREQIEACRRRMAFDELLELQYLVLRWRQEKVKAVKEHRYAAPGEKLKKIGESLPFALTAGQKQVVREIFADLQAPHPMARLLQGDVGCGKTVVAVLAALYAAENGLQTAFMAPTEILAAQHYGNWREALESVGVRSALLTASLARAQKEAIAAACARGEIAILFGTHALIYDYVEFDRLGLVIIDEQHRFGVRQRGRLAKKGDNPDLLVMTATPIPRTLALTLYGDLEISSITTMPPGRKPVRTVWRHYTVRSRVYQFVREEIARGGQAYIIYPLVEKSDRLELENVEDAFRELSEKEFRELQVGMVHGRIKAKERDEILRQFRDGRLHILMATTVVEVGIDNQRATLMLIEHAERFGLAQLHQLRGRIGRGAQTATLVALAHPPLSDMARRRLDYFAQTTDGFKIAEADLELRGPGEIFGLRQSGLPELRATRLTSDTDLLEAARMLVGRLLHEANRLDSRHQHLYTYLQARTAGRELTPAGG
ncbi:MAG TPA: ATP-dependent DNA helicase RecG [candidate division Zixibacteria bacterium]|nr:ATP-dependent DNA helicase RecG [candidate division Zixibacteria bacterium]MDD4918074.1 ATP-dependent DNA helicase RecG [candidate division Zixibacteria bacterium]HOD67727.1 ATP-dependent DNA helicase RecG [candidate division Zixibacteria bacterium]HPM37408.1 ATP-dependent DNA helicase RecG [candidate division Zixibacteria bacterium]